MGLSPERVTRLAISLQTWRRSLALSLLAATPALALFGRVVTWLLFSLAATLQES